MKTRNIGIFAHADAGKTTITEYLLHRCGAVQQRGSVDEGTAHTDTLAVERRRGISVRACAASFVHGDSCITLVDTPGHADFAAEVERAIWAIDGAVLVVSAVEGVQAQTELYFNALRKAGIPALFFINKLDRVGADRDAALESLRRDLGAPAVPLWDETAFVEAVCEADDALLEAYLSGQTPPRPLLEASLRRRVLALEAFPALCGSALKGQGLDQLLEAVELYLPEPAGDPSAPLCARVFALAFDKAMGRAAYVRLYSGALENRDPLGPDKVSQIRRLRGVKAVDCGRLQAGEIGIVYGLEGVRAGDLLGDGSLLPPGREAAGLAQPLLSAKAEPEDPSQLRSLKAALEELSCMDPQLKASWSPFTHELFVHLMGGIQTEVLQSILQEDYGLACRFSPPTVVYKETIARPAEGFVAYTMPKPCWAILHFRLTPLPRGSGVKYLCTVEPRKIPYRYRRQVEQTLPRALEQGMLGWELTDLAIELFDGSDHPIHTHPLDFVLATPMGILDGVRNAGSVLLEPMLDLRFSLPSALVGKLMAELSTLRAEFSPPELRGELAVLRAKAPAATMLDFSVKLAALSGGRGVMRQRLAGYEPCPLELGKTAPRRGVHPLDTAKYILAARSALESDIF